MKISLLKILFLFKKIHLKKPRIGVVLLNFLKKKSLFATAPPHKASLKTTKILVFEKT